MNRWVQGPIRTAAIWGTYFRATCFDYSGQPLMSTILPTIHAHSMSTARIRSHLRDLRHSLDEEDRRQKSLAIARNLVRFLPFQRATQIAVYASINDEVDTEPLIQLAADLGKHLFLPIINKASWRDQSMLFHQFTPGETRLKKNQFGILEPEHRPGTPVPGTQLELICVPMVGFNQRCDRIGMGAGYYDRAFAKPSYKKSILVGLAFACQEAEFTAEPHDVPMQAVITEFGILKPALGKPSQGKQWDK